MTVWVVVSADRLELPLIVSDKPKELAIKLNKHNSAISQATKNHHRSADCFNGKHYYIEKVEI